jgi:hypothetical protein
LERAIAIWVYMYFVEIYIWNVKNVHKASAIIHKWNVNLLPIHTST